MGNVNMEASQINYRNNSKPALRNVSAALTNLFNANTSIIGDINELTETVNYKADKIDIAPFFDEEFHYYIGDLVFESGRLWKFTANHEPGEWNQEEVTASNIDMALKDAGAGLQVKTKSYTGTGTNPNVIDFGQETPAMILGIFADPAETLTTENYEMVGPFGWGNMLAMSYWSTQSGGVPTTNNGGTNLARITYTGNSISIAANNASAVGNYNGQKYVVKYLV